MSSLNSLRFSRLLLSALTLLAAALLILGVVMLQQAQPAFQAAGIVILALAALSLLPVSREWISPSSIEIAHGGATIKWNNWQVTGAIGKIDLPAKNAQRLAISLVDIQTRIDPVGPLFLLASLVLGLLAGPLLPAWQASLYVTGRKQLDSRLGMAGDNTLALSFPVFIFGRRNVRRAVASAAAGT